MLATRKKYKDIFIYGDFNIVDDTNEDIFAYTRESEKGEVMLVLCNFSPKQVQWTGDFSAAKDVILSTNGRSLKDLASTFVLDEYEAIALLL